ncbi:MAG: enoyl-CoA hydratase/isomerase family protein [Beijerinckiaceae bacterium]
MANDPVLVDQDGGVAWVRFNRPEQMNALSPEVSAGFVAAIERIEQEDSARVVVITGTGRVFSAGGDLKTFRKRVAAGEYNLILAGLHRMKGVLRRVETSRRPYIAAVNGVAIAGGLEIILCCDLVFAAETATIGDGHLKFGVVPGAGSSVRLSRRLPRNIANRLLLTGDLLPARQLMEWGLVNEVLPEKDLVRYTSEFAQRMSRLSPVGLGRIKQMIANGAEQPIDTALRNEIVAFEAHCHSADFAEGLAAFAEKREPRFTGR